MNRFARAAIAATAVLVAAILGYNLLPGVSGPAGQSTPAPTATPTPTAAQTASPSPVSLASPDLHGPVAGGKYTFQIGSLGDARYFPIELSLPSGWIPQQLNVDEITFDGPDATGLFLGFYSVQRVYRDPCHPEDGYAGGYLGTSNTHDLVNELRTLAGFEAGVSSTVPIRWIERRMVVSGGRLQATHFVISNTIDTETAGCTDGALLPLFVTWTADRNAELTARGEKSPATNGGTAEEVWIVDRGDLNPLLIVGEAGRTPQDGRTTLDAIVASIIIDSTYVEPTSSVP